jgi:hypothetical protein
MKSVHKAVLTGVLAAVFAFTVTSFDAATAGGANSVIQIFGWATASQDNVVPLFLSFAAFMLSFTLVFLLTQEKD